MGSFAQGFRFAITLLLNMTLQWLGSRSESAWAFLKHAGLRKRLDKWQKDAERRAGRCLFDASVTFRAVSEAVGSSRPCLSLLLV